MRPPVASTLTASGARTVRPSSNGVQASAQRVKQPFVAGGYGQRLAMPWQNQALFYCATIPELSYASQFYARMLEKIRLYPAFRLDDDKTTPITEGLPVEILNRIQDPGGGRSQLQYRYGLYMMVTGECYLFGRNIGMDDPERWSMVWREELKFDGPTVTHMLAPQVPSDTFAFNDSDYEALPAGSAEAYRLWTPGMRFSGWPTSPMESLTQCAEELLLLSSAIQATALSRLVKSKVWFLPSDMEPPPLNTEGDEDPAQSPLLQDLTAHIVNAIENPGDPSSLAPFIAFVDGEQIAMSKEMSLHSTDVDYLEKDQRAELIERITRGLDLPPEVVKGMTDANHWAAWWISDDMWRSHGQPKAEQLCDDLCEAYLRPALRDAEFDRWDEVVIAYDASGVVVNPDRSKDASDAAKDGPYISHRGYRAMKNIPEEYAPDDEEVQMWLAQHRVVIGPDGTPVPDTGAGSSLQPAEAIATGDEPGTPSGQAGETSENTNLPASAFQAAAEMALYRCRELAGSRLRGRKSSCPDCLKSVKDVESSMVASALGPEGLSALDAPSPYDLVYGGADALRLLLIRWGNTVGAADAVAKLVEQHAARTLMQEKPSVSQLASLEMMR